MACVDFVFVISRIKLDSFAQLHLQGGFSEFVWEKVKKNVFRAVTFSGERPLSYQEYN